ncbi:MAG: hypothetical protein HZA01_03500 [Nitrospinae bacterium]|nr:hypothetical protein [Nitrospinota bacterium]
MTQNKTVRCECGFNLFENNFLKSRFVRFESGLAIAKCKRCKRETVIPFLRIVLPGEKAGKK